MSISILKKRKILQNTVARNRLNKANFYNENIKTQNIDFICCIPVNGFSSVLLQEIRVLLKTYNHNLAQFSTKSFLAFLTKNNINIKKTDLPLFYIGQMLIVTISLNVTENTVLRKRQIIERDFLIFIYSVLQRIPFSSLLYISRLGDKNNKSLVVQNISNTFVSDLSSYLNDRIYFQNLNNNVLSFIQTLMMQIVWLLSILFVHKNKFEKDREKEKQ